MNKLLLWLLILSWLLSGCTGAPTVVASEASPSPGPTTISATATPQPTASAIPPTPIPASIESIIAAEMRACFDFFWEQTNTDPGSPGYGLVRDRYPGSAGIASTASVGFGLTAYLIGVEKGYISYEDGYERVDKTLDTLRQMERTEGFYYHFVDLQTGQRAWNSEVSSVDTGLLLLGVLAAGEYFGGEVEVKARQIYDEVNWPWFLDESRQMFYMAYRPEKGFEGHWDFYAEQLMLYVLAAGSETYPLDETPYYSFTRHYARYGEGDKFIHSWFGSIFTYQFSHAWIDFRGRRDAKGVNWFENSVAASLAHYNFAVAMDKKYQTLGPDAWGLTASDGPDGYNGLYGAPPSGFDNRAHVIDDTIAPAGAIGSIIFLPEQVKQAILNYHSLEQLQGRYGFKDAYNLSKNWYAPDVIGIDKGISLLMLANAENGAVYRILMENPSVLNGLQRLQLLPEE